MAGLRAVPRNTASMMTDGDHTYTAVYDAGGEAIARFVHKTLHAEHAEAFVRASTGAEGGSIDHGLGSGK